MDRIGELAEAMVVWLWGDEEEMAEMVAAIIDADGTSAVSGVIQGA